MNRFVSAFSSPSSAALFSKPTSHQKIDTAKKPNRLALLLSLVFFGLVTVGCAQSSLANQASGELELHFIDVG